MRRPIRLESAQQDTGGTRVHAAPLGLRDILVKALKLQANQQKDGDSPIQSFVTGLHEWFCMQCISEGFVRVVLNVGCYGSLGGVWDSVWDMFSESGASQSIFFRGHLVFQGFPTFVLWCGVN